MGDISIDLAVSEEGSVFLHRPIDSMKEQNVKDRAILTNCLDGTEKTKKEFYEHFYQFIYKTVRRYVYDVYHVEETIHDSFIKIFKHLKKFKEEGTGPRPWMRRIAINTALDRLRKAKRREEFLDISGADDHHSTAPESISNLTYSEILKMVESLPVLHKTTFYLYEIDGYSHKEISAMLGISEAVSRTYLSRSKSKLKELFIINDLKE